MKNIYKNLLLGTALTVCAAVAPTYAQDVCADIEANTALYNKYIANYDKGIAQQKVAVEAAKEYIQKYENCATKDAAGAETKTFAEQVKYFKESIPALEKSISDVEKLEADKAMYAKFNTAAKAKNVADILASGKEVVAKYPNENTTLDVVIVMASAAFDELLAKPTVNTYNADLITYAKKAIEMIEAGKTSKNYGIFTYSLGTKTKALGVLNYSIGLAMLNDPAQKKDASAYFYRSSQYDSAFKNAPLLYQAIGANYLDEFLALDKKRLEVVKDNNGQDNEESLAIEAMQRGYADRALEAYARAYKNAKAERAPRKEYVDSLATRIKEFYAFRYEGKTLDNVDTYTTTIVSKPLTEPKTEITPVKEEVPATTTTTPATTTPATTTTTTTTTPTKPETNTTADTTAPKAKKPAPKKKGTR